MNTILTLASKDLTQMLRDRKTFLFLLIMPVVFTIMFGYAFNGSGGGEPAGRLPVGLVNQDGASPLSLALESALQSSQVIAVEEAPHPNPSPLRGEGPAGAEGIQSAPVTAKVEGSVEGLNQAVAGQKLAAGLIIPAGYDAALRRGEPLKLVVLADDSSAGLGAQAEIRLAAGRIAASVRAAQANAGSGMSFETALERALAAWQEPPVGVAVSQSGARTPAEQNPFSHSSPGMTLQFAVAGLLTCAQVIVSERKSRSLQRMLTTPASRGQILLGHYLAIFLLIFIQFAILILFGQLALKLSYFSQPLATLLIAVSASLCIAALGLLIGALAKRDDQAIAFSLIFMFLLAGLGGAWVPLEVTGKTFQAIGHLSPLAWAMDGFQNVLLRGQGLGPALLPAAALLAYAALFFGLARWKFGFE